MKKHTYEYKAVFIKFHTEDITFRMNIAQDIKRNFDIVRAKYPSFSEAIYNTLTKYLDFLEPARKGFFIPIVCLKHLRKKEKYPYAAEMVEAYYGRFNNYKKNENNK